MIASRARGSTSTPAARSGRVGAHIGAAHLFLLGCLFTAMPVITGAQGATYRLISDELSPPAAFVGVRIDGVEIPECGSLANHCTSPEGGGLKLDHDITALVVAATDVTIEARACNNLGQCSDWSPPEVFALSKPATPKGLQITITVNVSVSAP